MSRRRSKHNPGKPSAGEAAVQRPVVGRSAAEQPNWWKKAVALNVLGLLVVAVVLRVAKLDHLPGVNGDEAWMGVQAMAALRGDPAFTWRTPTGNPLNMFFFLPELALHAVWRPSFGLLRAPAAISGILALPAAFWLCRKVFGRRTAWMFTVLLAVLPINIAYSRFGWDACQTLLATTCAIFPALLAVQQPERRVRWLLWSGLGLAAAMLVHPTNIFIAPILAVAAAFGWRSELQAWWQRLGSGGKNAVAVAVVFGLASVGLGAMSWKPQSAGLAARMETIRDNASSASKAADFIKYFPRLFSGVTVYQYVAGSCADRRSLEILASTRAEPFKTNLAMLPDVAGQLWHDLPMAGLFLLAAAAMWRRNRSERSPLDAALTIGWLLMLPGFYLVAGSGAIMPHFERYAICLVAPTALLLARGAEWLTLGPAVSARAVLSGLLAVAWLWLGSFYMYYFAFIERTGDESHMAFRTASVEPKATAWRHIQSQREPGSPAWIISQEWWSSLPLKYLASADPELHVLLVGLRPDNIQQPPPAELAAALRDGQVWCVEFLESAHYSTLKRWLALQTGGPIQETIIHDFADRPLMSIMHAGRPPAKSEREPTE